MSERFGTIPTDAALVALARATMEGRDVLDAARELRLNPADCTELYDSLAFVLRLVFDAMGGSTETHPGQVAESIATILESMPASGQASRRVPLRLWN